jgi:hypothetical protein
VGTRRAHSLRSASTNDEAKHMKYSSTSRTLNLIFHFLLVLGFGAFGVYFSVFVVPFYEIDQFRFTDLNVAYNLYVELGVIGLSIMSISLYGLVHAIIAFARPADDKPVVKSFLAFIAEGYVLSAFFVINALVFFDLTASSTLAFVIVLYLVIALLIMIATNIPMVRLFDGKNQNPLLSALSYAAGISFGWLALVLFGGLLGNWYRGSFSCYQYINGMIGGVAAVAAIIAVLSFVSGALIQKLGDKKPKVVAISGYLTSASILLLGGLFLTTGILDIAWSGDLPVHLESKDLTRSYGYGFPIMSIIVGAALIISAIAFAIANGVEKPAKKPLAK